ncbi:MAG: HlyD family efflux transporter periplasmic adaptor subunit, partial [Gammaproteobacteria bacterium]
QRDIALTQKDIEKKQAEIALLLAGAKPEAIGYAQKRLEMARIQAQHSQKRLELLSAPKAQGAVSALEYEDAAAKSDVDRAAVAVEAANLALVTSPPLPEEVAVKKVELQRLESELSALKETLERTRLKAPLSGRITTPYLEQRLGTFLREGDLFAEIEPVGTLQGEILVPEGDIGEVRLHAPVRVRVWAYPKQIFQGEVTAIAPKAEELPDNPLIRIVRVTTEIPNDRGALRSGMTGYAKIEGPVYPSGRVFTRALMRFFLVEVWSWIP